MADAAARILVVDDEAACRYVLSRHLRDAGFHVREAATGAEALEQLDQPTDLVILDINLPDVDGREICRLIKATPRTRHVMVLHASATFATTEDRVSGLEGGADGYLTFPINLPELVANVRALLRIRNAEEQARTAGRLLETTFNAISDGVCLVDADGGILQCNPAMGAIMGELEGGDARSLYDSAVRAALAGSPNGPGSRKTAEVELGGHWYLMAVDPVLDDRNRPAGAVHVLTDITEQKRLHAELEQRSEELHRANRAKDEFLAMLGHELRNPLGPILNAVAVMREETHSATAFAHASDVVERQVHHMARLLDDLLDVARITRGAIELRLLPVNVAEVLRESEVNAQPLMAAKGHQFEVDLPEGELWVRADPTRLEQVIWNLLTNAAKYTPDGGRVRLEARREANKVVVSVRDNGRGIPPSMLPHIFDLFTQVTPSLDRSLGGLGLGLTLVKRLVEMHGGEVSVCSAGEGRGAEFQVLLPVTTPRVGTAVEAARPAQAPPSTSLRVLVVEDNTDSRETLRDLLQLWGHEVTVAINGVDGLRSVLDVRPNVALIDIGLPGIDGYEVSRQIRAGGASEVKLVALTGYGQPGDRERAITAGFNDHLVKPVDPEKLKSLLTRF